MLGIIIGVDDDFDDLAVVTTFHDSFDDDATHRHTVDSNHSSLGHCLYSIRCTFDYNI